ncbi:hypothetical protein PG999_001600 [Apiospora kogelbergensis]|uniref:Uncharacterized protein n=1 Tax=Apiospora kogelbergensis TaxID=1337665 RepID=A0AAW0R5W9_9PEZI
MIHSSAARSSTRRLHSTTYLFQNVLHPDDLGRPVPFRHRLDRPEHVGVNHGRVYLLDLRISLHTTLAILFFPLHDNPLVFLFCLLHALFPEEGHPRIVQVQVLAGQVHDGVGLLLGDQAVVHAHVRHPPHPRADEGAVRPLARAVAGGAVPHLGPVREQHAVDDEGALVVLALDHERSLGVAARRRLAQSERGIPGGDVNESLE